jgi:hypothetical protein
VEKRPDRDLESRRRGHHPRWDSDDFFGLDVEKMSPRAQAVTGLVTGGLILLAAALLIAFTQFWWLIFIFGWAVFPAFGVFVRGVAGLVDTRSEPLAANARERELLQALQSSGELTPAQAAMETSLTVNEADEMLKDLAAKGHLDVRVRGGGLFYGLWETDSEAVRKRLGDE